MKYIGNMNFALWYDLFLFFYMLKLKRIYEGYDREDGFRVLVDRLWPRGVSKVEAHIDLWLKEIAPSTDLRKWFGHDPKKWEQFKLKYRNEVKHNSTLVDQIKNLRKQHKVVTILYAAKDELHNEAVVLYDYLEKKS